MAKRTMVCAEEELLWKRVRLSQTRKYVTMTGLEDFFLWKVSSIVLSTAAQRLLFRKRLGQHCGACDAHHQHSYGTTNQKISGEVKMSNNPVPTKHRKLRLKKARQWLYTQSSWAHKRCSEKESFKKALRRCMNKMREIMTLLLHERRRLLIQVKGFPMGNSGSAGEGDGDGDGDGDGELWKRDQLSVAWRLKNEMEPTKGTKYSALLMASFVADTIPGGAAVRTELAMVLEKEHCNIRVSPGSSCYNQEAKKCLFSYLSVAICFLETNGHDFLAVTMRNIMASNWSWEPERCRILLLPAQILQKKLEKVHDRTMNPKEQSTILTKEWCRKCNKESGRHQSSRTLQPDPRDTCSHIVCAPLIAQMNSPCCHSHHPSIRPRPPPSRVTMTMSPGCCGAKRSALVTLFSAQQSDESTLPQAFARRT